MPADRGALGRYVDGLIGALDAAGADLAVVCQRADEERYGRLAPSARVVTGPTALSHRSGDIEGADQPVNVPAERAPVGGHVGRIDKYARCHDRTCSLPGSSGQPGSQSSC